MEQLGAVHTVAAVLLWPVARIASPTAGWRHQGLPCAARSRCSASASRRSASSVVRSCLTALRSSFASFARASAALACASRRLWNPTAPSVDTLAAFLIRPMVVIPSPIYKKYGLLTLHHAR